MWEGKLQPHTTQILASLPHELQLERVSERADKIHDNNQDKSIYATSYSTTNKSPAINKPGKSCQLEKNIENLTIQIQSLVQKSKISVPCPEIKNQSYSPCRTRRGRSNSFSRERFTYNTCWYHYKIGKEAKKCREPCIFNSKTSCTIAQHQGNDYFSSK